VSWLNHFDHFFLTYHFSVFNSGLNQAATNFYSFDQGRIAAYRLYEMISRSSSAVNQDGTTPVSVQGNIEFRNVYFSYLSRPEIPILSGFYLTVPAKKAVALVGRNGSGKSSIIPLMERFYDPTLGMLILFFTFPFCFFLGCVCAGLGWWVWSRSSPFKKVHISWQGSIEVIGMLARFNGFFFFFVSLFCGAGEVLLDGENIKNLKLEWLRSQIGLVTQEPALLSLSIRDNIAYGRDATFDQIEEAAKIAHAHTLISSLERGYDTQVNLKENINSNLSFLVLSGSFPVFVVLVKLNNSFSFQVGRAGLALTEEQKIKLSIARAVLLNPSILLLDEVTGGLDFEAERAVQEALDLLMLGRSTIIIARRLSLIRNADYIAVMEEGQLVEMGTHDELLTLDGLYAELLKCEEAAKLPRRYNNTRANYAVADMVIAGE
jgi:ABC-type multidrug transport system fused ATPase/permease subunit